VVDQRQARVEVVDERRVVRRGARVQPVLGGGGGREDGVLEADALAAPEAQYLQMHRLQVAARERVDETQARERRVGRVVQGAVLGVRREGRLERVNAVGKLGERGERLEAAPAARGRPPRVVGDEGVRLKVFEVGLGATEREVLHRTDASGDGVEVVAEHEVAARARLLRVVSEEVQGRGHDRRRSRVAAEKELALVVRWERAAPARIQVVHDALT
jgi:hypothetical protein